MGPAAHVTVHSNHLHHPSVTQRIKWPADGWGLVYETSRKRYGYARLARTLQAVWNGMTQGILRLTVPERF